MLEKLGNVLKRTTDKIANAIFLDKDMVDGIIRDLQRALIEADVNILLVKQLSEKIRQAAFDERIKGVEKKEHIIKLLHDELISILGVGKELEIKSGKGKQNRVMLLGIFGVGKTTTAGKLGNYYQKRGHKVALIGLDVHRPAAGEQLKQLAERNNLTAFIPSQNELKEKAPEKTWKRIEKENKLNEYDLLLIDTAGRDVLNEELITEIKKLNKEIKPTEKILVMAADIGQAAKKQATEFQKALEISGVIITRMDSTAKAGGALTACSETNAPVYFITTGEKINDLELFKAESFLSRLLGMGDLQTLLEKVKLASDEKSQAKTLANLENGKLTLEDVVSQVKSMSSLGGFGKIKDLLPGFGNVKLKEGAEEKIQGQEQKIAKWEHIIKSMTREEINNPEILEKQTSRIARVAKGSGATTSEVRALLKQYKMLNELVKGGLGDMGNMDPSQGLSQKQMMKMAKKFMKKGKFRM